VLKERGLAGPPGTKDQDGHASVEAFCDEGIEHAWYVRHRDRLAYFLKKSIYC